MRKIIFILISCLAAGIASADTHFSLTEEFNTPRFYDIKYFMYNTDSTTQFMRSNNTGFEWGAYSPVVTKDWGPIGYLYSDELGHHRNALCFTSASEYPGSYSYCHFDSESAPGSNDSLTGIGRVVVDIMVDGPQDLVGLMIRDANHHWYFSKSDHGIYASGSRIIFSEVDTFLWMRISDSLSDNLNHHTNITHGIGDIRQDAVEGIPDLNYITGGGLLLHEAVQSDLSLRIGSITWEGKLPEKDVKLVSPVNHSTLNMLNTVLKWEYTAEDTVRFDVWMGVAGGTMERIADSIENTSQVVSALSDNSTYNWRVDAIKKTGEIDFGNTWTFSVSKEMPSYFNDLHTKRVASSPFVHWTNVGPCMSGYCDELWAHPTDPNSMYMSLDMGNSYYTHDNGLSWITKQDWDHDGENYRPVWTDFSRQDPDFGYAIDEKGNLLKTTNRGATWTTMAGFPASRKNSVITVDPNNDNNWYVGAGQIWRVKAVHRSLADIHGTQYRNTEYGHIYISKNKGLSWTEVTKGFNPNLDVAKIFVDPEDSDKVYAFTNYGFYKSTDGGYNWEPRGKGLPYNQPRDGDFYYDPESGDFNLYLLEQTHFEDNGAGSVISTGGVYISTDRGENWTNITGNLPVDLTRINSYGVTSKYYRALGYWFGISSTEAESRFPVKPGSILTVFNRIVVSARDPNTIFLSHNIKHDYAFGPGDIWRTTDGGANWVIVGRNGPYWVNNTDQAYWESRNNPMGMNMRYAHLHHEMEKDGVLAGTRILLGKSDGDLICVHEQQTLRSSDNGDTWYQIDDDETEPGSGNWVGRGGSNLPGEHLELETGMKRYLFCSGEHGLWISAPGGEKVKPEGYAVRQLTGQSIKQYDATSIGAVAVHPHDTNTFYMLMFRQSHRGYLRRTQDGGKTWENISYPVVYGGNLSSDHIFQYDLKIDKDDPENMYFCVPTTKWEAWTGTLWNNNGPADYSKYGVFRSQDSGYNWHLANNGLPEGSSVYRLEMDPADPKTIYAALNKTMTGQMGGLYRTTNSGDLWEKVTIPSMIQSVTHLFVDRNTGALYLSAGEAQATIEQGGLWVSRDKGSSWEKIFYMPFVHETYTSNVNPDFILVNVGRCKKIGSRNAGVYFSKDGGLTWTKANYRLGQPGRIKALRPDPFDENVIWAALNGTGWNRGVITNVEVRAMADNKYVFEGEEVQLDALKSIGIELDYHWCVPPGIELSCTESPTPSFTAPQVNKDTVYKFMLRVSTSTETDTLQRLVYVRNMPVNYREQVDSITVTQDAVSIMVKEVLQLSGNIYPDGLAGVSVFWKSLDPEVASLMPGGLLTGAGPGITKAVASIGTHRDTITVTVVDIVDGLEMAGAPIRVYPNPVTNTLYIEGMNEKAAVSVLDLYGVTLLQSTETPLHLGRLRPGIYLLRIQHGNSITMHRILKE